MYLMGSDEYECDICGFREKWDAHDDHRGDMWECERCGKHFCTNCFKKACGEENFRKMLSDGRSRKGKRVYLPIADSVKHRCSYLGHIRYISTPAAKY